MIEAIAELFDIEYYCKLLDMAPDERKRERQKKSRPILARIYTMVRRIYKSREVIKSNDGKSGQLYVAPMGQSEELHT